MTKCIQKLDKKRLDELQKQLELVLKNAEAEPESQLREKLFSMLSQTVDNICFVKSQIKTKL